MALIQTNGTENFGRFGKNGEKVISRKVLLFFPDNFHRYEPFQLSSPWNFRVFHTKGKRSLCQYEDLQVFILAKDQSIVHKVKT